MARTHSTRVGSLLLGLVACLGVDVSAQTLDLTKLSLEDLLNVEITSVSRKPQSLASAPAAVTVITHEEIHRSGASSLPELLRLVPGVQVARYSNSKWSISARGMGTYYASKLLVLIDGRSVYNPDFSGVFWDVQELPLDDIERIEVVRGPGGTMWGANAVNGVINVITKAASQTTGAAVTLTSGSTDHAVASFRYGAQLSAQTAVRFYGNFSDRSFGTVGNVRDSLRFGASGFRLDQTRGTRTFTLQGDVYNGHERTPSTFPQIAAPYSRTIEDPIDVRGGHVLGRWAQDNQDGSGFAVKVYYENNVRNEYIHEQRPRTIDFDFQQRLRAGRRHDLLWGSEFRQTWTTITSTPLMQYTPADSRRYLFSAFGQDEIALTSAVKLTLGAKLEHHEVLGAAFAPNVRALWTVSPHQSVWGAVARGVRTPSLADQIGVFDYLAVPPSSATRNLPVLVRVVGSPMQEHMEAVTAYEAGWRLQPVKTVAIDLTAFRNQYEHLTSYARTPAALTFSSGVPFLLIRSVHDNLIAGESHGAEMMTTWTPSIRWSLSGATTWLDTNLHVTNPTVEAGNSLLVLHLSPHVQFTGRSSVQLTKRLDADAIVSYTGPWQKGGVSGYSRTDVRVGWRASRSLTADVGVQNLFERRHMETALFLYSTPTEIRRTGYARLIWKF